MLRFSTDAESPRGAEPRGCDSSFTTSYRDVTLPLCMSFTRRYGPASHRADNGSGPNDRSNLVHHAHRPGLLAADTAGLLFRRTTSPWSPAAGHTKSTDPACVVRRALPHVVADVPDR